MTIHWSHRTIFIWIFGCISLVHLPCLSICQGEIIDTLMIIDEGVILFDSDRYNLDSVDITILGSVIRKDSVYRYLLTGHTDADGSDEYNLKLSERRVNAVRNFLMKDLNIDSTIINIDYKGEKEPISSNLTDSGKQRNRRVTIRRLYPVRLRKVTGSLISDSGLPINEGFIYMQSRYYRDSFPTMNDGTFKISLPNEEFVRLNATARNHFYVDTLMKVTPRWSRDSLYIGMPYLRSGQQYVLPQMHFVGNQDVLLERSLSSLTALTRTMVNSDVCAIIEGHVNRPSSIPMGPGTFEYNLALARAQKIFNHLTFNGVDSSRLNPIGYSNWYMVYPYAENERDQELNRRVEMVIIECDDLTIKNQGNALIPVKIGTQKRLHELNH